MVANPKPGQVILSVRADAAQRIVEVKRDHVLVRAGVAGDGRQAKVSRKSLKSDRYHLLMEAP